MTTSLLLLAAIVAGDAVAPIESPIAFVVHDAAPLTLNVDRLTLLASKSAAAFDFSSKSSPRPLLAAMAMPFLPGNIETSGPNLIRISRDNFLFTGTVGDASIPTSLSMELLIGPDRKAPEHSLTLRYSPESTRITLMRHEELISPTAPPINTSWRVMVSIDALPNSDVILDTTRISPISGERHNTHVMAPWSVIASQHSDVLDSEVRPLFKEIGILTPPFTDAKPTEGQN